MTEACETTDTQGLRDYFNSCTLNANPDAQLRGWIDGTITDAGGLPLNPTATDIIVYRQKPALKMRKKQLTINLLGLEGGRPYVDTRLSRFSGETIIDWVGGTRPDGSASTGRLQQTHSFPYLGRIDGKINQFVFQTPPAREGGDIEVIKDISRDSKSVNDLMRQASSYRFACKWCWIMVDAPARKEDGSAYTVAEKKEQKIRPYWRILSPLDVMDWSFDARGVLQWIKTIEIDYDDSDPTALPSPRRVIKLWEIGKCTKYTIVDKKDRRYTRSAGTRTQVETEEIPLTDDKGNAMAVVPFVLVGEADAKPTAFDDLESINRTIMDLGSVDRANFFNCNYPQLVLPKSLLQTMQMDGYGSVAEEIGRLLLGYKYPIMVDKDDVTPSYLIPDASALKGGSERLASLKRDLFEVTGLALEQESRQVASAESKQWDFQDVSAVMTARAETLEDAETRAVAISKAWDSEFEGWAPAYNRKFDIGNLKDELAALVMAGNISGPPAYHRLIVKKIIDRVNRIGSQPSQEEIDELAEELKTWNPNELLALPEPPAEVG